MAEIYICSLCQRPALRDADGACVGIHDVNGNYKHIECPIDTSIYAKSARVPTPYASDASDTDRSRASSGDEFDDCNYRNDERSYASARFLESYEKRANASKFSKFSYDDEMARARPTPARADLRYRLPTPIPRVPRMSLREY